MTARQPHDPERFDERVAICIHEGGLSEGMAYRVAWADDQRLYRVTVAKSNTTQ